MGTWIQLLLNKQSRSVIIGLCVGIAISLLQTPFIDDECHSLMQFGLKNKFPSSRNLRSNKFYKDDDDDYEPKIVSDLDFDGNIPKLEVKSNQKLIRPRYYSTELGIKQKLFVAVISSCDTIESFGIAINQTISRHVDSIIFFLDGMGSKTYTLDMPIVGFKDSKPLLNIFRVLSYLRENYVNSYDFFFIITDHSYIHGSKLLNMVQKISVSQQIHMGALTNHPGSMYCSLDGGIILSQRVLNQVGNHLSWCTRNTYSDLDTDNLGRCILHATDKPCLPTSQGQRFSNYHLREDVDVKSHLELIGSSSLVREAVTVSGVTEAKDIYKLHVFYLQEDIRQMKKSIKVSQELIEEARPNMPNENLYPDWPVGHAQPHKPHTRFDMITWDTFNVTHFFHPNELLNSKRIIGADLEDIKEVTDANIAHMHEKSKGNLEFLQLEYGHRRFDPTRGMSYILSLKFKDNSTGQTVSKKVKSARGLTNPEQIAVPYVTENGPVALLVPVDPPELSQAIQFIKRFMVDVKTEHVYITMMLLYPPGAVISSDNSDMFKTLKDESEIFNREQNNNGCKITTVAITTVGRRPSDFAMVDIAVKKLPEDTLFIVTRSNAFIATDFINRARMNTLQGVQIYSPVPFTLYHADIVEDPSSYDKMEINRNNGRFDSYNTDHISFYVSDYLEGREQLKEDIPVIYSERDLKMDNFQEYELDLYEMFVQTTDLHVLRSPEPILKLNYKPIVCPNEDLHSKEYNDKCSMRQGLSLGLRTRLSKLVIQYNKDTKH